MLKQTVLVVTSLFFAAGAPSLASVDFTAAQAERGQLLYEEHCASCHARSLKGNHLSPSLVGDRFDRSWRGKKADTLAFHVRRMPPEANAPEVPLTEEDYAGILAYVLQVNGFEAGAAALPAQMAALAKVDLPALPGVVADVDAPVTPSRRQKARLAALTPVTQEMLDDPPPGDWLYWGRSNDGQSFSPLTEIDKETVKGLKSTWRTALRPGVSMSVPLVHDGIMFLHSFPDTVLALDATNGDVLWRYQYESSKGSSQKMGLGIGGDKIFVPTSDLHVVAIDMRTGEPAWDHEIDLPHPQGGLGGYQLRSAPLVAGGKVLQGVTSSFIPKGGFIVALDPETGEESWRFNTIARPGAPGGNTWNGLPLDKRSGGSVWHQGTYDPELDLVYYGVAPTYDTGPLLVASDEEGVTNEALFTNCTIALRPSSGELVWYYQHMPNDQWDLDWAFERQVATLTLDGEPRKVVMNVGKMAILEVLDAATGEYLFSMDSGTQNVITAIDPETGEKTFDLSKMPDPKKEIVVCPNAAGARSWPPTSFSPPSNLVFIPITEWCMGMGAQGVRLLTSGVGITDADHPGIDDGTMGQIQAMDAAFQEVAWTHDQVAPVSSSMLATAGGLVFAADLEPSLKAFDERTGEVLWQTTLDDVPSSSLITYSVGDKQYLAVLVGIKNIHVSALEGRYQKLLKDLGKADKETRRGGAALWVFSL
ncbi:MAG: PQQ-binding-like beta-propeller repeat protein [Acidobacteriota bacterium]